MVLVEEPHGFQNDVHNTLADFFGPAKEIACAASAEILPPPHATPTDVAAGACVRLAGFWHNSLIEGPGRRTTAKLQGCPIHCIGCVTPDSWDPSLGSLVPVDQLAETLLNPSYERDGISILGGEPFAQPEGLLALVRALRKRGCEHILAYSGYTYNRLRRMAQLEPAIGSVLDEIEILIHGPYVNTLADGAGCWTGSGNQRVIDLVATRRTRGPSRQHCRGEDGFR
jgi:anaerobic ribonucleoside-triphosphate reductase activating protein